MNNNILNFYLAANKLKQGLRTGWLEVGISSERIESFAEHVYGCMALLMALDSEKKLDVDILKVLKLIFVRNLEKMTLIEATPTINETIEERKEKALQNLLKITNGFLKQDEFIALLEESYKEETDESIFAKKLTKIESDLQAKIYDLNGEFAMDKAMDDVKNGYGEELANIILSQMQNASDGWILYDRRYYTDPLFQSLSEDIQNLSK